MVFDTQDARCSSVVEHPLMVRRVVGSIPHDRTPHTMVFDTRNVALW